MALVGFVIGCGQQSQVDEPEPILTADLEKFPDPAEEVADEVKAAVSEWVLQQMGDAEIYAIPERGGQSVSGTLATFHTVHQNDADTYSVCVDFVDGDNTYDVDAFIDRGPDGLAVRDLYLHKINGDVVPG